MHHPTDRIMHPTGFVTSVCGALTGLRNWFTMSGRSTTELHLTPLYFNELLA